MSEKLTIRQLQEYLYGYSLRLQTLPVRNSVDANTYELFDNLARESHYMFSYIIDYLEQNQ